jgi:RNA-directed DNA polymerase
MSRKVSHNFTTSCYVLKCDIRRFFASIDHSILIALLEKHIVDRDLFDLIVNIIESFDPEVSSSGIPLGNLTSQIFGNIYLNEFDQYMRHTLKIPEYIRYADDFVIFSRDQDTLRNILTQIQVFLSDILHLELHPEKIFIESIYHGVDWLGWHIFPHHRVMRTKTKRRITSRLSQKYRDDPGNLDSIFQSYLALMSHGNTRKTEMEVRKKYGYIFDS